MVSKVRPFSCRYSKCGEYGAYGRHGKHGWHGEYGKHGKHGKHGAYSEALLPFSCSAAEDGRRRIVDATASSVFCEWDDPTWARMVPIAWLAILVYVVGLPITLAVVFKGGFELAHGRGFARIKPGQHAGMNSPTYEEVLGPLYVGYFQHAYWWEVWVMLRKCLMVMDAAFLHDFPDLQLVSMIMILTTSLGLHLYAMPFVSRLEHRLELVNYVLHVMITLCAAIFMSPSVGMPSGSAQSEREAVIVLAIVIVLFGVVYNLLAVFFNLALVCGNFEGHLLPRWLGRFCRPCSWSDVIRPWSKKEVHLTMQAQAMRHLRRNFGSKYTEALRPWIERGDRARVQRCVRALKQLETFNDPSTYDAPAQVDGSRVSAFLASSSKTERDELVLTLAEQHSWLQRAQPLRGAEAQIRALTQSARAPSPPKPCATPPSEPVRGVGAGAGEDQPPEKARLPSQSPRCPPPMADKKGRRGVRFGHAKGRVVTSDPAPVVMVPEHASSLGSIRV